MIGVVRCLAFLKEVGWHPRQDVSEQERKNKLRMSKTSDFITLSLFYETRKSDFDYGERSGSRKESESGMKALRLAVINGRITRRALVADTGMSLRQASYVLMGLTKNGYLVRNGKKESPSAYYLLTKKGKILLASGE
jgi:predicted HTH transcriptional regulator